MRFIISFLIVIICPCLLYGQKKFKLTLVVPDSTVAKNFSCYYYEFSRRAYLPITPSYNNNQVTFSHSYNTLYAQLFIDYGSGNTKPGISIVTTDKPAIVTISGPINEVAPFNNYTLKNAQNFDQESSAMIEYIKDTRNNYLRMYDSITPKLISGDSLNFNKLKAAKIAMESKRLDYICSHPNSYYSFISFEKYSIGVLSPGLLLQRFSSTFPAKFRNCEEGIAIKTFLMNRAVLEEKKKALSFTTKDIDNNPVILKNIYARKHVLLVFWGTWCKPCIEEIPLLREIRVQYSKEQLEIISVASQSKPEKVRQLIKEQQMDWIHIVNQEDIIQLYQVNVYPEMYLIDTTGDIIYKSANNPTASFENLKKTLDAIHNN